MHQKMFLLVTTIKFWNFSSKVLNIYSYFFLITKICYRVLRSVRGRIYVCFPFGKFHSDIHNKMADNNGIPLPHEIDFDIIKDFFCWNNKFIRGFEDYQLLTIAYRSNPFSSALSTIIAISFNGVILEMWYPMFALFFKISFMIIKIL